VVTTPTKPAATTVTPTKPAATTPTPSSTYVAAPTRPALYGYPDLFVSINNAYPAGNNRTTVQFTVQNIGTNLTPAGWIFNTEFPWDDSSYTYVSPSQQALYPGDRIVYTLSFDTDNGYDSRYNDDRYDECDRSHNSWDKRDWQDWYEDAFDTSSNSRDSWSTSKWEDWYDDYCDDYDDNRNYHGDDSFTITVDPLNRVYENNEQNNDVSARL
jgi:hypothetical protein